MATYAELQSQIAKLQAEAEKARKDEMSAAIAQIRSLMKEHGITIDDLNGSNKKVSQSGSPNPKYRDPESGSTWSGRGKQPAWFKRHLAAGHNKESLLVTT